MEAGIVSVEPNNDVRKELVTLVNSVVGAKVAE